MKDQKKAYLYAGLTILLWSTVASAFKISLRYLNFVELLSIASFISTLCLFIILLSKNKIHLLKTIKKRDFFYSSLLGALNPFLYYLIVFKAYELLPAQQAQPLNLTWGIVIVLLSAPILKQKITGRTFIAVLVSFCGVLVISTEGNFAHLQIKSPFGVGLAVGSSLIWSFYWLLNTKDKLDPIVRLFLNFCWGTVFTFLYLLAFFPLRIPPVEGILGAVYSGIFEMGVTYYVWLKALKLSQTTARVSILIYIMPFISLIFIHLTVGEDILLSSVFGLALIVSGILLQKLGEARGAGPPRGQGKSGSAAGANDGRLLCR
ncbi:MAG: DMT family transporter [Candidatus Aminicenantes bacterium]|nr:DMT family transporter [Candidatus Aminicenantes bacterium]